jgi:hypothetical protein
MVVIERRKKTSQPNGMVMTKRNKEKKDTSSNLPSTTMPCNNRISKELCGITAINPLSTNR